MHDILYFDVALLYESRFCFFYTAHPYHSSTTGSGFGTDATFRRYFPAQTLGFGAF